MTTDDTIKILAAGAVSALMKPIVEAYMPSKEKTRLIIKKILVIGSSYGIPIVVLTISLFDESPIDKAFIFKIVFFTSLILINIITDYLSLMMKLQQRQIDSSFEYINTSFERINELRNTQKDHINATKEVVGLQHQLVDLIKDKLK